MGGHHTLRLLARADAIERVLLDNPQGPAASERWGGPFSDE